MKRFQISFVVALLMAAVSAPAQRSGNARGERNVRGGIASSRQHVGAINRGTRSSNTRAQSSRSAGNRRGVQRGAQRGSRNSRSTARTDPIRRSQGRSGRHGAYRHTPVRRAPVHSHGYYRTVQEPVLVHAGHWRRQHVSASYGWVYDSCGYRSWGILEPAHYDRVWVPAQYEYRQRRVWVGH